MFWEQQLQRCAWCWTVCGSQDQSHWIFINRQSIPLTWDGSSSRRRWQSKQKDWERLQKGLWQQPSPRPWPHGGVEPFADGYLDVFLAAWFFWPRQKMVGYPSSSPSPCFHQLWWPVSLRRRCHWWYCEVEWRYIWKCRKTEWQFSFVSQGRQSNTIKWMGRWGTPSKSFLCRKFCPWRKKDYPPNP